MTIGVELNEFNVNCIRREKKTSNVACHLNFVYLS